MYNKIQNLNHILDKNKTDVWRLLLKVFKSIPQALSKVRKIGIAQALLPTF